MQIDHSSLSLVAALFGKREKTGRNILVLERPPDSDG